MDKLDTDECRKLIMITSLQSLDLRKQLMEEEEKRTQRKLASLTFNQMMDVVSDYVDRTNAIKNLDKKRKKDAPRLKEDRKKDEVGTTTRRVESMEGTCFKCNKKGHFARDCSAKVRCETCSSDRHVTALHKDGPRPPRSRSRSRDESIRDGSRSRESSLSHWATARSRRTPKSESQRSKSPRRR